MLKREGPAARQLHEIVVQQHLRHGLRSQRLTGASIGFVASSLTPFEQRLVEVIALRSRQIHVARATAALQIECASDVTLPIENRIKI